MKVAQPDWMHKLAGQLLKIVHLEDTHVTHPTIVRLLR